MNKKNKLTKLIMILANGNIYHIEYLSNILNINKKYINKYIKLISRWGLEIYIYHNKYYQLNKKIELLNYNKIFDIVKYGKIIIKSIINSTNQYMLDSIEKLNIGDVCIAEYQKYGRGKHGSHWVSPFGCNLYLSIYWSSKIISINNPTELSLMISVVIAEILNKVSGKKIKVKWPNDLYLNEKKLAGILIETKNNFKKKTDIIIGMGINIAMNNKFSSKINQKWTNLEEENGKKINRNYLAGKIILALRKELLNFEKYGFHPFMKRLFILNNLFYSNTESNLKKLTIN